MAQSIVRHNSFSYNVNEGLLQSTIIDVAFDQNNFCWLSFPNGIQKFDGKSFIQVPIQPGLPDDKLVFLFRCSNGNLLISHGMGISWYNVQNNRFVQVYSRKKDYQSAFVFMGEDAGIIYLYTEKAEIIGIDCHNFAVVQTTQTPFPGYASSSNYLPKFSGNIMGHNIALKIDKTLYLWNLPQAKLVQQSGPIDQMSNYFLQLYSDEEVWYYAHNNFAALQRYHFGTGEHKTVTVTGKDKQPTQRCHVYAWGKQMLMAFDGKIYETDTSLQVLQNELVNFQNLSITGSTTIAKIKEDNFGNLYLMTVTNGFRKVIRNNYTIRYYGGTNNAQNFTQAILPDKTNNRVLVGSSNNGLFVFDTLQHLIKHIAFLPGQNQPFGVNIIIKAPSGNYHLFVPGSGKVWQLSNDLSRLTPLPIVPDSPNVKNYIYYFGNLLKQNKTEAIVQSQEHLFRIDFTQNRIAQHAITKGYIMSGILYKNRIVTHANNALICIDAASFKELWSMPFENTGYVRCFAKPAFPLQGDTNHIYIGCNNGIFVIDSLGHILQHITKANGLPDDCIYAMAFDKAGFLWCSTNKGIIKLSQGRVVLQLKKEDGLQENEFNTNAVAQAEDGSLYWGGVNGVSSFYPAAISNYKDTLNLFFTSIKANNEAAIKDTAAWKINHLNLPYDISSLSFDFIAMGNGNPNQYVYQYKMEGVDKEWIQQSDIQTVRYYLPPGRYVFHIYASRSFKQTALPLRSITIVIRPPYWKTWWFMGIAGLLGLALLTFGINRYNRQKYQKQLQLLEAEKKIKLERERISRDLHDSLGASANAVLYNTELLEQAPDPAKRAALMSDLRFASKDIITSLRETIWALNKAQFSAEDCLVRIRNFIQPFNRYYEHIQFSVQGDAPVHVMLDYKRALHLVRLVQEAVTNAIKHAQAATITIFSLPAADGWELRIEDDGRGFDYAAKMQDKLGNGLTNMAQRARDGDFTIKVQTGNGQGTHITLWIIYDQKT